MGSHIKNSGLNKINKEIKKNRQQNTTKEDLNKMT